MNQKIGRNDPCWCGSGIKFKKCHFGRTSVETTEMESGQPYVKKEWIKSAEEIEKMRRAGRFNGQLMDYVRNLVAVGENTEKIDDQIRTFTLDHGHIPACMNYRGYPKNSCISINEVVCHGIPGKNLVLKEGDIVNVDITTIVDGYHGDQSETFLVGHVDTVSASLVEVAANAMVLGIQSVKPGEKFSEIGRVIQDYVEPFGFSVVLDYTGHGIGRKFHEDPPIYHFRNKELSHFIMAPGMTFTVEPMVNAGTWKVDLDATDGWTVRTRDLKRSAQFEHTVLVTGSGVEILTLPPSLIEKKCIAHLATHELNRLDI